MEVIEELIKLAKEMDAATKRGEDFGLIHATLPRLNAMRGVPPGMFFPHGGASFRRGCVSFVSAVPDGVQVKPD